MESLGLDVQKVTDLIASRFVAGESTLSVLKLQKLLYYVEAWHVTFFDKMLFNDDFEAWVHGPVCRPVFERFKHERKKFMYSDISSDDFGILNKIDIRDYDHVEAHVENILGTYGGFSGPQLELLTHREPPWLNARGNLAPNQPCTNIISKDSMRGYYKQLAE